jgi:integrase
LNSKLNEIENTIKKLFHQFIKDYERKPEPKELKYIFIKEYFEGLPQFTTKKKISLLETFDEYIEIKKLENTPAVSKRYLQAKNDLIQFGKKYKQQIQFENINMEFRNKYVSYLQNDLGLADSTTYRRVKYVKTILTYALNSNYIDKLNINLDLFNTKDRTGNKIALSENEVHELETIDLSGAKRLDEVRDRFLLGCYTGLRYSDFSRLNKNHIIDDKYIQIEQQKVKTPVTIPFTDKMRRVFLKYDFELPEPISEQKFNQYLKELGAKCDTLQ